MWLKPVDDEPECSRHGEVCFPKEVAFERPDGTTLTTPDGTRLFYCPKCFATGRDAIGAPEHVSRRPRVTRAVTRAARAQAESGALAGVLVDVEATGRGEANG